MADVLDVRIVNKRHWWRSIENVGVALLKFARPIESSRPHEANKTPGCNPCRVPFPSIPDHLFGHRTNGNLHGLIFFKRCPGAVCPNPLKGKRLGLVQHVEKENEDVGDGCRAVCTRLVSTAHVPSHKKEINPISGQVSRFPSSLGNVIVIHFALPAHT